MHLAVFRDAHASTVKPLKPPRRPKSLCALSALNCACASENSEALDIASTPAATSSVPAACSAQMLHSSLMHMAQIPFIMWYMTSLLPAPSLM